ncbi:MAG: YebC/PmpR family DNA-binding transcriptional regulator [Candidatus Promineifilaceae bacterium]
MAGHSKWANIKHKKAATDSKRAKIFTKISKELVIAARGGGDPITNPSLRLILSKARAANMPNKNIERAVKRGTGELDGGELLEMLYEGYGPHGVGLIIEVVTDNKNRAVADLRHALSRNGGSMAESGAVMWQFNRMGMVLVPAEKIADEDEFFMTAAEAGAEDIEFDGDPVEVLCAIDDFKAVQTALSDNGYEFTEANLVYNAANPVDLEVKGAMQVLRLTEILEDLDDVQNVFSALDITDEVMEAMMK